MRFWNAQLIVKNIKPHSHGKSQRSEIFVNKGGGAEAERSNARQGIARNLPRAQPLKSQHSEIFVNKGGGAEAEASNARQGIAKNLPRAQPLKPQRGGLHKPRTKNT